MTQRRHQVLRSLLILAALELCALPIAAEIPSYEELAAHYEYDADMPLDAEVELIRESNAFKVDHVVFASTNDERVTSIVATPKGEGAYPALVLLHGYGGQKEDWDADYGVFDLIASQGIVCIAIDAELHGERAEEGRDIYDMTDLESGRDAMIQTIVDCRRAVDYLVSLPDVDPERIGFIGGSMGAILGAVFCAVEERVCCSVLVVGGADWGVMAEESQISVAVQAREAGIEIDGDTIREMLAPADPLHFVAHISPRPVLFQNGNQDTIVPVTANKLLIEAAKEPKEVDWYDAGHALPPAKLIPRVYSWLDAKLRFGQTTERKQ